MFCVCVHVAGASNPWPMLRAPFDLCTVKTSSMVRIHFPSMRKIMDKNHNSMQTHKINLTSSQCTCQVRSIRRTAQKKKKKMIWTTLSSQTNETERSAREDNNGRLPYIFITCTFNGNFATNAENIERFCFHLKATQ